MQINTRDGYKSKDIVLLIDDKPGNYKQGEALARIMGWHYRTIKLQYNNFAKTPNFLKGAYFRFKNIKELKNSKCDIVISCGRRPALAALTMKQSHPTTKIIQIMHPNLSLKKFDLLLLPEHDRKAKKQYPSNTEFTPGSIAYVPKVKHRLWDKEPTPRIGLLLGGPSKSCKFDEKHMLELMQTIKDIKGSLVISTSRRTTKQMLELLKTNLPKHCNSIIYEYGSNNKTNPYNNIINECDKIIVTSDSISMVNDALTSDKPVYIFYSKGMLSGKHNRFLDFALRAEGVEVLSKTGITADVKKTTRKPYYKVMQEYIYDHIKF